MAGCSETLRFETAAAQDSIDITGAVREVVAASGVARGQCQVMVLHSTAAVVVNETADPNIGRDVLGELPVDHLLAPGRPPVQCLPEEVATHLEQPPGHDVVEGAHALEQGDVLKGPGNPKGGNMVGMHSGPIFSLIEDAAFIRFVKPVDDIQQGCFAGTVWSDDDHNLLGINLYAYLIQGL